MLETQLRCISGCRIGTHTDTWSSLADDVQAQGVEAANHAITPLGGAECLCNVVRAVFALEQLNHGQIDCSNLVTLRCKS